MRTETRNNVNINDSSRSFPGQVKQKSEETGNNPEMMNEKMTQELK